MSVDNRDEVLERDGRQCRICGAADRQLEVHHATPQSDGGSDDPENLLTLCDRCHTLVHSRTREEEVPLDPEETRVDMTQSDLAIIKALSEVGASTPPELEEVVRFSEPTVRRRLHALTVDDIVAPRLDGKWDFAEEVSRSAVGRWPEKSARAARYARNEVMRRMFESGMTKSEIADIVGLDDRTVGHNITQARALRPPLEPMTDIHLSVVNVE
jgi:DNA-binding transcriptional ArsR family regulator